MYCEKGQKRLGLTLHHRGSKMEEETRKAWGEGGECKEIRDIHIERAVRGILQSAGPEEKTKKGKKKRE